MTSQSQLYKALESGSTHTVLALLEGGIDIPDDDDADMESMAALRRGSSKSNGQPSTSNALGKTGADSHFSAFHGFDMSTNAFPVLSASELVDFSHDMYSEGLTQNLLACK